MKYVIIMMLALTLQASEFEAEVVGVMDEYVIGNS